jgi:hypothetical protein
MSGAVEVSGAARKQPARRTPRGSSAPAKSVGEESGRPPRKTRGQQPLVIGAAPRADLLPTEVHVDRRQRAAARRAWAGVVVIAIAVGLGTAAAGVNRMSAQDDLVAAEAETATLLQQQLQYKDVRVAEHDSTLLESAQEVGGGTEIDWSATLSAVQRVLPADVVISGVSIDSATATQAYAQSDDPLQGTRVATMTIDAKSASLPSVPDWLTAVRAVPGFVDGTANTVALEDSGAYVVNLTIHLDEKAYDNRYVVKKD